MNELIKIETRDDGERFVDARVLHEFLGVKSEFRNWIKNKINQCGLSIESDYYIIDVGIVPEDKNCRKEYFINPQSAVVILQCERGAKADQARRIIAESVDVLDKIINALKDFEVPDDLPDMFVYAIREIETGNIKIGISKDPKSRLTQLQTGNSNKLVLVDCFKADNRFKDEKRQHRLNSDFHIHGEWFSEKACLIN